MFYSKGLTMLAALVMFLVAAVTGQSTEEVKRKVTTRAVKHVVRPYLPAAPPAAPPVAPAPDQPQRPGLLPGLVPQNLFQTYAPAQSRLGQGIHREMMGICPGYMLRQIHSFDRATQCHEATHAVCAAINDDCKQRYGSLYIGGGRYVHLRETRATVAHIAQKVPAHLHNTKAGTFKTYLVPRGERNATFILEEWTCYANDAQCTRELKSEEDGGLDRAREFSQYADVLVAEIKAREPDYPDLVKLEAFVAWQKARVAAMPEIRDPRTN